MLSQRLAAFLLAAFVPLSLTARHPARVAPADITGHWEAPVTGDGKTFTFSFDFVAKGASLTGTLELSNQDRAIPITDGKINGSKVSFKGLGIWTGELVGEELRLTRELDYGKKQHLVAKRTKAPSQ